MKSIEYTRGRWYQIVTVLMDADRLTNPGSRSVVEAINAQVAASGDSINPDDLITVDVDDEAVIAIERAASERRGHQPEDRTAGGVDSEENDHDGLDERGEPYYPQAQEEIEVEKREAGEQD